MIIYTNIVLIDAQLFIVYLFSGFYCFMAIILP